MPDNLEIEIRAALEPFFGYGANKQLDRAITAVVKVARLHIEAEVADARERLSDFLTGANETG